jgi:uncharacterized protein YdhG (YjbR/CyaY superfamily)
MPGKPEDFATYVATFPAPVRKRLVAVRRAIRAAAPRATEVISYGMPAFRQSRMLVYFAGFQQHIGLYPPVHGDAALEKAVAKYAGPKGNLKFPHDGPLPLPLISRIVRLKVKQDRARAAGPAHRKKK